MERVEILLLIIFKTIEYVGNMLFIFLGGKFLYRSRRHNGK